jgi:anti-sigma-K factor RskA
MNETPTNVTPSNPDRENMLDLIAAYAVHALEPFEIEYVEDHLDDDPEYRRELTRHVMATAALTTDVAVPPTTWESILAKTRVPVEERSGVSDLTDATDTADPLTVPTLSPVGASVTSESMRARSPENVIALDAARAGRRSRLRTALVAAAATAAIAVPLTLQFAGTSSPSLAALSKTAAAEPGVRNVELKTADGKVLARVIVTKDGRGYLSEDSLPRLADGKAYQLWAITGDTPVSAGVLGRNPGIRAFTIDAPTKAIAISVEPTIGSTQPTSTPIAVGAFV